jgi:recombination protein RecR
MSYQSYPSQLLEEAVSEFSKLPGIGKKTALRLVLHLLKQTPDEVSHFGNAIISLRNGVKFCKECNNISDSETCRICADSNRDHSTICVVENIKDVMSVENTGQYHGVYHVLGGIISPMDGIGPSDLKIDMLEQKILKENIGELVFALSATAEGDTTNFYLYRRLSKYPVKMTTIARGVAVGDELEYADSITLGRSIVNRIPFEGKV